MGRSIVGIRILFFVFFVIVIVSFKFFQYNFSNQFEISFSGIVGVKAVYLN